MASKRELRAKLCAANMWIEATDETIEVLKATILMKKAKLRAVEMEHENYNKMAKENRELRQIISNESNKYAREMISRDQEINKLERSNGQLTQDLLDREQEIKGLKERLEHNDFCFGVSLNKSKLDYTELEEQNSIMRKTIQSQFETIELLNELK